MLLTQACNCRRQKKIISTLPLHLRITTSSLTQDIGNYVFVQSVEEYANQDIFGYWEKRNTSIVPTVLSTSLLEDWHDNGIFPVFWCFPDLQNQFVQARGEYHSHNVSRFRQLYHTFQGLYLPFLHWWHSQLLQFRISINKCNVRPRCNGVHGRAINLSCHVK